jgi:glycerophosphoryl diester phosphodiesterase
LHRPVEPTLSEIHAQDPSLPLVRLYSDEETSETVQADLEAAEAYAIGVGPSVDDVDAGLVQSAHARCLAVHPYTLEEKPDMQRLVDLGVDGMFANFPDRLEEVLGEGAVDGNLAAGEAADASRACRSGAGPTMPNTGGVSLLQSASLGALLLGLGLTAAILRRASRPPR